MTLSQFTGTSLAIPKSSTRVVLLGVSPLGLGKFQYESLELAGDSICAVGLSALLQIDSGLSRSKPVPMGSREGKRKWNAPKENVEEFRGKGTLYHPVTPCS